MNTGISPQDASGNEGGPSGSRYWRSLDEYIETPEFRERLEREFPQGADEADGVNRRHFLKIMAASFGAAGLAATGCRRPEQYIVPYARQPEWIVPGRPLYYATSFPRSKDNLPLIVETHQSRPTKVEGNGEHKPYKGATSLHAQASVLDLYDPDRSTRSSSGNRPISLAEARDLFRELASSPNMALAVLAAPSTSPTRARLVRQLQEKFPNLIWTEYEPGLHYNAERAARQIFGQPLRPRYRLENASVVLSLDADFLHDGPGSIACSQSFAERRKFLHADESDRLNRLYQVESDFSITGGMADHRLRLASAHIPAFTALIAAEVLEMTGEGVSLARELRSRADGLPVDPAWAHECAADLVAHAGEAAIIAGDHLSVETQQLVFLINELTGARGKTLEFLDTGEELPLGIGDLAREIQGGRVDTLLILGGNPAYDAPADLSFGELVGQVRRVIRYGYEYDETSLLADTHIAATHYLESWGDGRTYDGTVVPVQPMILPLFEGLQELELLGLLTGEAESDPYQLVYDTISPMLPDGGDKQHLFNGWLNRGLLEGSAFSVSEASGPIADLIRRASARMTADAGLPALGLSNLEVRTVLDSSVRDGRYNNNGWLQECPDPMTKLAWDNAIIISPRTASELGFDPKTQRFLPISAKASATMKRGREMAPMAELRVGATAVRGPLHIQPGLADFTVIVPLGYGRRKVGRVGEGTGFDAYPLTRLDSGTSLVGATLTILDEVYPLANTQGHWSMEGRAIVRESNHEDYVESAAAYAEEHPGKSGSFASKMGMEAHSPPVYGPNKDDSIQEKVASQPRGNSLYGMPDFDVMRTTHGVGGAPEGWYDDPHQWGMTIDLNACTGCNACVVACQSENNIPIVGKDQVMRGREMHWIRLDRYFASGEPEKNNTVLPEDPQSVVMPVPCMHCETAPCEQVCPVNATVHDTQGLNVMAYNRCVGTRYCMNNCPYKVRRFNFFDWNKRSMDAFYWGPLGEEGRDMEPLVQMQKNPDVTVRMRGVMEKCTYCQQRIQNTKINQKAKAADSPNITVPDGSVRTACQQVCPTQAIEFGNLLDPKSRVSLHQKSDRNYALLGYLNTRPRTTFLARVRNPNPKMPDYYSQPLSRQAYETKFGHGAHGGGDHGTNGHGSGSHSESSHEPAPAH